MWKLSNNQLRSQVWLALNFFKIKISYKNIILFYKTTNKYECIKYNWMISGWMGLSHAINNEQALKFSEDPRSGLLTHTHRHRHREKEKGKS